MFLIFRKKLSLIDRFINFYPLLCGYRIIVTLTNIPLTEFEVTYNILVFSSPDTYVARAITKYISINCLTI